MSMSSGSLYGSPVFSAPKSVPSALATKLGVRFVITTALHSDYWEGSCRVGEAKTLSYEAERAYLTSRLDSLRQELKARSVEPDLELVEPTTMYAWAEKGNPEIKVPEEQLNALAEQDAKTDVYVVTSSHEGVRIAERYRKPVIILNPAGWAVDMPCGIRAMGISSFHAENMDAVFDFLRLFVAKKALGNTKLLNVTNFPGRQPWGVVSSAVDLGFVKSAYGMDYEYADYGEFFRVMDQVTADAAAQEQARGIADLLIRGAESNRMTQDDVEKSVLFYLAAVEAMSQRGCNAFTIECFELCAALEPWNRRFTPCLAHALLKDTGHPSACEGDISVLLAMAVEMYLSRKAVYMGNPTIDKQTNILNIHHSVASLMMGGIDGAESPYTIRSFTQVGFGATLRHDFTKDVGQPVTVARFNPSATKILVTSGEVVGGGGLEGLNCAQNIDVRIPNGYEFWRESQNFGHHLALVYGDYVNSIRDLGDVMGFEVVAIR